VRATLGGLQGRAEIEGKAVMFARETEKKEITEKKESPLEVLKDCDAVAYGRRSREKKARGRKEEDWRGKRRNSLELGEEGSSGGRRKASGRVSGSCENISL